MHILTADSEKPRSKIQILLIEHTENIIHENFVHENIITQKFFHQIFFGDMGTEINVFVRK